MSRFPIHTIDGAPEQSRDALSGLAKAVGLVPNLAAGMAESPSLLRGFLSVREIYQNSTLTGAEIQAISLVAAYENECAWCMAFHSFMAGHEGISTDDTHLLRTGRRPRDGRLGALSDFARALLQRRGAVDATQLARFFDAGYSPRHALDVVLGLAFSVMANYAGHLVNPPLDRPFVPHEWKLEAALTDAPDPQLSAT